GAKSCSVAHGLTHPEMSNLNDRRTQVDDGLRLDTGGSAASYSVEKNSGTDEIPFGPAFARNGSAVVGVQELRPGWQRCERFAEESLLLFECSIIELGRMEVRESSFGREQLGEMPNRANVAPRNSGAAHTRVD